MSSQQPSETTESAGGAKDPKHPYIPLSARKIERGRNYASAMVNDQKTMMENLRFLRHQMEKEERQLKVLSDTLYKRSLPNRQTEDTPKKLVVTSCKDDPFHKLPPYPITLTSSNPGKASNKVRMDDKMISKIIRNNPSPEKKQSVSIKKPVYTAESQLLSPLYKPGETDDVTWSKDAEARWAERYQRFLTRSTGKARPTGKGQVDNGTRSVWGRSLVMSDQKNGSKNLLSGPARSVSEWSLTDQVKNLSYRPASLITRAGLADQREGLLVRPTRAISEWSLDDQWSVLPYKQARLPRQRATSPIISDIIEDVIYEKNGRRFYNYSGLGDDGKWLLMAVDSFYNNRFGGN